MKKVIFALFVLAFSVAKAQDTTSLGHKIKRDAKATGHAIGKGATKVSNKTAEIAAKGESKVVDKTYKEKAGPNGETVYISNKSKYYYVDKKGKRHYVTKAELKDKKS